MATFIRFQEQPFMDRLPHRTKRWAVTTLDGTPLGQVRWYNPWRRYCFMPQDHTCVFEQVCLREIADFVETKTREHKEARP